jgi:long-chain acyl-CoA synthetase
MNLVDIYRGNADDRGSDPAITFARPPFEGVTLSWSELVDRAAALRPQLLDAGVRVGSRAALPLVDHPDTLPTLLAMWEERVVPIVVDPRWGEATRTGVVAHSRADAVVTIGEQLTAVPVDPPPPRDRPPLPDTTAVVAYTSGSTGSPKGIALRHERLVAAMYSSAGAIAAFRGSPPARVASSLRLSGFGVMALHYLWSAAFRAEVVVLPLLEIATAARYWDDLSEHGIDQAILVPPLFELLLRLSKPGEDPRRPLFVNSSGALSAATHRRFMDRFGATVLNCYGLSEATFACTVGDTDEHGTSTVAVGRPDLVLTRLCAADGTVVEGSGDGELEVRGPTVSDGYYDNAEANAALFAGPWLRTGDLARRDETGRLWIVGRLKDAVMKGGATVYLGEVEEVCAALDGVLEAVAVRIDLPGGVEDIGLIARPVAGEALDGRELKESLRHALGADRSPRRILVTDRALPRIGQSKIDRRASRLLWSELVDQAS